MKFLGTLILCLFVLATSCRKDPGIPTITGNGNNPTSLGCYNSFYEKCGLPPQIAITDSFALKNCPFFEPNYVQYGDTVLHHFIGVNPNNKKEMLFYDINMHNGYGGLYVLNTCSQKLSIITDKMPTRIMHWNKDGWIYYSDGSGAMKRIHPDSKSIEHVFTGNDYYIFSFSLKPIFNIDDTKCMVFIPHLIGHVGILNIYTGKIIDTLPNNYTFKGFGWIGKDKLLFYGDTIRIYNLNTRQVEKTSRSQLIAQGIGQDGINIEYIESRNSVRLTSAEGIYSLDLNTNVEETIYEMTRKYSYFESNPLLVNDEYIFFTTYLKDTIGMPDCTLNIRQHITFGKLHNSERKDISLFIFNNRN